MKETKTIRINGFFSVRAYKKGVPRKEQSIIAEGENIAFIANINEQPAQDEPQDIAAARQYGIPYEYTKEDGTVVKKLRLKFKIGKHCEWYKNFKPENAELDNKRYEAVIKYGFKEKKADNPLSPSGLWANAIAIKEIQNSAFESDPFGEEELENIKPQYQAAPTAAAQTEQRTAPVETPESKQEGEEKDLPF